MTMTQAQEQHDRKLRNIKVVPRYFKTFRGHVAAVVGALLVDDDDPHEVRVLSLLRNDDYEGPLVIDIFQKWEEWYEESSSVQDDLTKIHAAPTNEWDAEQELDLMSELSHQWRSFGIGCLQDACVLFLDRSGLPTHAKFVEQRIQEMIAPPQPIRSPYSQLSREHKRAVRRVVAVQRLQTCDLVEDMLAFFDLDDFFATRDDVAACLSLLREDSPQALKREREIAYARISRDPNVHCTFIPRHRSE
jgi:hypothetical protein